jgi:hypothetical protein
VRKWNGAGIEAHVEEKAGRAGRRSVERRRSEPRAAAAANPSLAGALVYMLGAMCGVRYPRGMQGVMSGGVLKSRMSDC